MGIQTILAEARLRAEQEMDALGVPDDAHVRSRLVEKTSKRLEAGDFDDPIEALHKTWGD